MHNTDIVKIILVGASIASSRRVSSRLSKTLPEEAMDRKTPYVHRIYRVLANPINIPGQVHNTAARFLQNLDIPHLSLNRPFKFWPRPPGKTKICLMSAKPAQDEVPYYTHFITLCLGPLTLADTLLCLEPLTFADIHRLS